jgi:hypothetical protein
MSAEPSQTTVQSKFVAFFQNDATPQNNKPSLKGTFTLPSGEQYSMALWSGDREDGKGLYLNGQATAQDVSQALRDKHRANDNARAGVAPAGLELQRGHIVMFETPAEQLKENPKRPNFYGYVHTAEGFFRIAAWNRTGSGNPMISGTIDVNQPRADSTPDPEPVVPLRRGGAARAPRAGQGTA